MSASVRAPRTSLWSEIGIPRIFAVSALVVLALALQSTVLSLATILGVIPQLVLVVVLCLAFTDGERVGLVAGFFGGMLQDLQLPDGSIVGMYALIYTLVGYTVGVMREYTPAESVWTPVITVGIASAVVEFGYAGLAIILGQQWVGLSITARVIGLIVLYNTLLTPLVYPVVRKVAARYRPEKVYR